MINANLQKLFFAVILVCGAFSFAFAQNGEPPPGDDFAPPRRPNLLQELGLSRDQIQQLRQINREWNPRKQQAQRAFQEAKRELDEAIYLDEANESIINQRKEAVKAAHSEFVNTQTTMQTLIRRILTNQQLARFRQLRQQFAQGQVKPNNRPLNRNNPNRRLENQQNNQPLRPRQNRVLRQNQRP
jgi:Spy/CpxP family protein refolding chaperone